MDRRSKKAVMDALDKSDSAYVVLILQRNGELITVSNIEQGEDLPKVLRSVIDKLENGDLC